MARLRTNVLKWGNKYDGPNDYKHCRQGAAPDAFWDDDEPVEFPKASRRRKPKKKKGCPGNDFKAHVYVWVEEKVYRTKYTAYGFVKDRSRPPYTVRRKTCCGCMKVARSKYDWSNYYG